MIIVLQPSCARSGVPVLGFGAAFFLPQALHQPKPSFNLSVNVFQASWHALRLAFHLRRVVPALLGLAWAWVGLAVLIALPAALGGQTFFLLLAMLGAVLGGICVATLSQGFKYACV